MKTLTRGIALAAALFSTGALADRTAVYEVSVTNLTKGQTFTPILVAGHGWRQSLFTLGDPASKPLAILAEAGDTMPLTNALIDAGVPADQIATILGPNPDVPPPLTGPGQTASIKILAPKRHGRLSVAAMLIPTNDTFMALNGVRLPRWGTAAYTALAYDAGTEANDQNCAHIPGPVCKGLALSDPASTDEGFVYVSNGMHDLGAVDAIGNQILDPHTYDWRNPVARISVRRLY